MKKTMRKVGVIALVFVAVAIALFLLYKQQAGSERVSGFGKYQGYSKAVYDG